MAMEAYKLYVFQLACPRYCLLCHAVLESEAELGVHLPSLNIGVSMGFHTWRYPEEDLHFLLAACCQFLQQFQFMKIINYDPAYALL